MILSSQVKYRKFGVCHVPRYIAKQAKPGQRVISIEYQEEDRPEFEDGVIVLPITGDTFDLMTEVKTLGKWVEDADGANIIVHCEVGMVRSRAVAYWIAHHYNYNVVPFNSIA